MAGRSTKACMGGFCCPLRGICARHEYGNRFRAEERICSTGTQDQWIPIEEGMMMDHLKRGEGLNIVRPLAARPAGVNAQELAVEIKHKVPACYALLRRLAAQGHLIERRGNGGGAPVLRFFTDAKAAEAYEFEPTWDERLRAQIVAALAPCSDGMTMRDLTQAVGKVEQTVRREAQALVDASLIAKVDDLSENGRVMARYFGSEALTLAWLSVTGNTMAEKLAAREVAVAANREQVRDAGRAAALAMRATTQAARAEAKQKAKAEDDSERANEIAAALKAKEARRLANTPPAHQPGEPVITSATKITRVPAPPGRFETRDRVIGGFATKRIGEYDRPASAWAEASCA
jgi:hypothetical protein